MRYAPFLLTTACALVVCAACIGQADASLVGLWQFNDDLSNEVTGGTAMTTKSDSGLAIPTGYIDSTIGGETARVADLPRLGYNLPGASGEHWLRIGQGITVLCPLSPLGRG